MYAILRTTKKGDNMHLRFLSLNLLGTALVLFLAVGCSTSGTGTQAAGDTADPEYLSSADVNRDPDRVICRRQRPTGSRISEKICMTARQWYQMGQDSKEVLDRAQRAPQAGVD